MIMDFYDKLLYYWNKIEVYNAIGFRNLRDTYKWLLYFDLKIYCNCYDD